MAFDPTGATVAVGNCEGHVVLVDAKTLRVKRTVKGGHMIFVTTMAYSPDGSVLLSGSADASACCTVVSRRRGTGGGWDDVFEKAYAVIVCAVLAWLFFTVGRLSVRLQHAAVGPGGNGDVDVEHIDVLGGLKYEDIKRVAADVRRKREAAEAESGGGDASATRC
jgi:WD40 repeat protein